MSLRGPAPLTVVQLPGEQVQVQGVIQTAQSSSVIHSPQVQTVQVTTEALLNNPKSSFMYVKRLIKACLAQPTLPQRSHSGPAETASHPGTVLWGYIVLNDYLGLKLFVMLKLPLALKLNYLTLPLFIKKSKNKTTPQLFSWCS